ncbi:hypothetical protein Hanom_Chr03g00268651 [Helianthus anomalus]
MVNKIVYRRISEVPMRLNLKLVIRHIQFAHFLSGPLIRAKKEDQQTQHTQHNSASTSIRVQEFTISSLPSESPFRPLFPYCALSCSLTQTAKDTAWSRMKELAGGHFNILIKP